MGRLVEGDMASQENIDAFIDQIYEDLWKFNGFAWYFSYKLLYISIICILRKSWD